MGFKDAVEVILRHEGGYVDDPHDRGGETNFGISKRFYPNEDIKNLTRERAIEIYSRDYWYRMNLNRLIGSAVATQVFDAAVNSGIKRAGVLLQKALNAIANPSVSDLAEDGIVGTHTISRANTEDQKILLIAFRLERVRFYLSIVREMPAQERFLGGWLRRALE